MMTTTPRRHRRFSPRRSRTLLATLALVTGSLLAPPSAGAVPRPGAGPCATSTTANYSHVVWIVLENVGYSLVGSPRAPYFNALAGECGLATNDLAVAHPSLPNYLALTSGSTQGVTDDAEPASHPLAVANIFSQLRTKWRAYAESMPSPCDRVTSGTYAARHNPVVYYTNVPSCARNDVTLSTPLNLSAAFTFVAPNVCDDMHSCPVAVGDAWLRHFVALVVASAQYRAGSLALFITVDENDQSATNRVPTIVVAPTVARGQRVSTPFTHYSLLRTTEALLHLPFIGGARSASSMVSAFHL